MIFDYEYLKKKIFGKIRNKGYDKIVIDNNNVSESICNWSNQSKKRKYKLLICIYYYIVYI